ncbi:MAG TPA: Fe-S cluster assembly protein SufD [Steroidobacteraceae bacterium]|nr:Fe-S cluster assembly protein SufD [Steroidobacteraceae bacterium]
MSVAQRTSAGAQRSAALRSFEAQWLAREPDAILPLREQAMERMLRLGLPGARDESWRYTPLRQLGARSFVDAPPATDETIAPSASLSLLGVSERVATVLMVNGHPVLPGAIDLTIDGTDISSLKSLARTDPGLLTRFLAPLSDAEESRFDLLNTALFVDGLYVRVKARCATPIVILHLATADRADTVSYPRVIIEVAPGAHATLIEHHVRQGAYTPFCNSSSHLALRRGAALDHYRVFATDAESTHVDSLTVGQERDSVCRQFTIVLGGGLVRATLDARLSEPNASLENSSLLVGHEQRHVDCVNVVHHAAADTRSRQTARSIASGESRVIFNSKVVVDAGAVHAESQQSCRGLLLSPTAEIDSRPQLEIHADEVKCAHGASTGRLDADMLFYLLARGLDRETAQSLLIYAFLGEVLVAMTVPTARAAIETALITQLPNPDLFRSMR